jgi:hypothetical protein
MAALDFPGYTGIFFKEIGNFLGHTVTVPIWFILTAIFLTIAIIIRLQHRKPREYICEKDCMYKGKYINKGAYLISTETPNEHFRLIE